MNIEWTGSLDDQVPWFETTTLEIEDVAGERIACDELLTGEAPGARSRWFSCGVFGGASRLALVAAAFIALGIGLLTSARRLPT